jgi:predicted nucleic acid-binding protein
MVPLVYVETSIISYLTARAPADSIKKAWHTVTRQWWDTRMPSVRACVSPYVIQEISMGDASAANARLDAVRGLILLDTAPQIDALARYLLAGGGLPAKARLDALHIASAAYHGVDIVLTWNFKRIANPVLLPVMRGLCAARGYRLPELVSPLEMLEQEP